MSTTDILSGLRVVEFGAIGPAPFCAMMLADHGASITRIVQPGHRDEIGDPSRDILNRGKTLVFLNLADESDQQLARSLCQDADVVIEGFRPGVMERLGLGPDVLMADNPRLVFGRMTGWGQSGPYAQMAGHDINYIGLSGALHACGRQDGAPMPPLNLVGDFGGGGMLLAFGVLAACIAVQRTGQGRIVDCAMTDGSAILMAMIYSFFGQGLWRDQRETNLLDGGCPFYATYETADRKYVALGALEDRFFAIAVRTLGLEAHPAMADRWSPENWPRMKDVFAARFREKTREDWSDVFAGTDACVTPVLSLAEAANHPQNAARGTFLLRDGLLQPAAAPRFYSIPASSGGPSESRLKRVES